MVRLLADEHLSTDVLDGLQRHLPDADAVRVQDVGLMSTDDRVILEWAAREDRVIVTLDRNTLAGYAYDRVRAGIRMPGVIEVRPDLSIGQIIDDLLLIVGCSLPGELEGLVLYRPLQR